MYGRMKTGKCISEKYSDLGCWADVQTVVSQQCSGHQSCSFRIRNLLDHQGNCQWSATRSYLEVSHTCLKGNIEVKLREKTNNARSISAWIFI